MRSDARLRHAVLRAWLLAPLSIVAASAVHGAVLWMDARYFHPPAPDSWYIPDARRPYEVVFIWSLYGVPMAYLLGAVVGIPAFLLARRIDAANAATAS